MSLFEDDPYEEALDDGLVVSDVLNEPGLLPPRESSFCLGHVAQERFFLDLFDGGSLPHAMIFSGAEGIGKATMAFRFARFLFKYGKDELADAGLFGDAAPVLLPETLDVAVDDPVFRRVASGGHADLLYVQRAVDEKKGRVRAALDVESVRKIEQFLRKTASEGGWRVVIVDDADTMNRSAQNAILKILEEPPAKVLIVLIAHRAGRLIPTIHSRCRKIDFSILSGEVMEELLGRKGLSFTPDEMDIILTFSGGSIGQALAFVEDGGLETLDTILQMLVYMPQWDRVKIHELGEVLSAPGQDKEYRMFSKLLQWVFRQVLFAKARGLNALPPCLGSGGLEGFLRKSSLEKLVGLCDSLKTHFETAEFSNLDRREAIRGAFVVLNQ